MSAADLRAWRERGRMVAATPLGHRAFLIDEGNPDAGAACDTQQMGVCAEGVTTCLGGEVVCVRRRVYPDEG